jgi:hypothetical protein
MEWEHPLVEAAPALVKYQRAVLFYLIGIL